MTGVHKEAAFESSIEAGLLATGWEKLAPDAYDRGLGLVPGELVAFLEASQPKEWAELCKRLGGPDAAGAKVVKRVADEL